MKTRKIFIWLFLLIPFTQLQAQDTDIKLYQKLMEKIEPSRLEETHHKILFFKQDKDSLSGMGIIERDMTKEIYHSKQCFKIVEKTTSENRNDAIMAYIDAHTLLPEYVEINKEDTLRSTFTFQDGKMIARDRKTNFQEIKEIEIPHKIFLSYNFVDIVQANDFAKNKIIRYQTINPERKPTKFVAERIGEKELVLPNEETIDCWIIKFTATLDNGKTIPAGYRYIDKTTGKVLAFKTSLQSDSFFMYQVLFFN